MTLEEIHSATMDDLRKRYAHLHSKYQLKQSSDEEDREAVIVWNELKTREAGELLHIPNKVD